MLQSDNASCLSASSVVVKVLNSISATEAAAERVFSAEKILHSTLRNKMKPNLVTAMLKIRYNAELR